MVGVVPPLGESVVMKATNLVLIGAPRSGTNMLRDILSSFDEIGTWPCDEINYIWRHGNVRYPSDEFPPELATPKVADYIRGKFESLRKSQGVPIVLEKTCANCLRVPFVDRVIPDAKYIHIYRNGLDTVSSARLRWTANLDLGYIFDKARYVPVMDIPYYGTRFLWNRLHRLISKTRRLAFWGPTLADMDRILANHTLEEVCALQWQRCVESAESAFSEMTPDRVIRVDYDDFVTNPAPELKRILEFVGLNYSSDRLAVAVSGVSRGSIAKGQLNMPPDQIEKLRNLIGATLGRYGKR